MEGRKRWSSFDDGGEKSSYSVRDRFKFPRTTSSANELYKQRYSEPYSQPYNEQYNQPYSETSNQAYSEPYAEQYNQPYNEQYNQPYNEEYNQPYNEQSNEHYNKNYGEPQSKKFGDHYNPHFSAPLAAGSSRSDGDVSLQQQRFPKEPGVQQPPWNRNKKAEGICCCPAHEGNMCPTLAAALPALLGGGRQGGGGMINPFLPFPLHNNNNNLTTMDPVQKAVFKHTFGGRGGSMVRPRRKQPAKCGVCQINFNSDSQAQAHFQGSRHARKLKMQQQSKKEQKQLTVNNTPAKAGSAPSSANRTAEGGVMSAPPTSKTGAEPANKMLFCSLCKVSVNSRMQLDAHNSGTKHKNMLEARSTSAAIKAGIKLAFPTVAAPPSKASGALSKNLQCLTCNITVNSEIQLKEHMSSRRHQDQVEGKPSKPRFNKSQRMEVTTSSDLLPPPPGSASSSLACPVPGPVDDGQDPAPLAY
ncbi:zinc finger protein 385D-like [Festucalex cinctus]